MRVKVITMGGMVAAPPRVAVDTTALPDTLLEQLRRAVSSGALASAVTRGGLPQPDASQFVLEIEDDDGSRRRFEIDEAAAGADMLDLVDDLIALAGTGQQK